MVRHHLRLRHPGWRFGTAVNGVGAAATFVVALVVGITKFAIGAWVPIVVVPLVIVLFKAIARHYRTVSNALEVTPDDVPPPPQWHTFVVLVGRVHKGVVAAVQHARSLRPDHIVALHIADDDTDHREVEREWERFGFDVPLEIVDSPYRELVEPVERYLDELDARWDSDRITVVIPEFVVGVRSVTNVLHGQNGLSLKLALLDRPNTAVLSVPFQLGGGVAPAPQPPVASNGRKPRLAATHDELDRDRLRTRFGRRDGPVIAEAPVRCRTAIEGEVTSTRVVPRAGSPWLEVKVSDGTATVVAVFTGRRRIPGMDPGRGVRLDGMLFEDHGRTIMMNPTYTLLAA
jgi:hypothetical protein